MFFTTQNHKGRYHAGVMYFILEYRTNIPGEDALPLNIFVSISENGSDYGEDSSPSKVTEE